MGGKEGGWAGAPAEGPWPWAPGPRQALGRGGRVWGKQCCFPELLLPQTTDQQRRFRIHTSVHHNTDEFPPLNCLRETLWSADV